MIIMLIGFISLSCGGGDSMTRKTISLNGTWYVAEGSMDSLPEEFTSEVIVPGLIDMASPAFDETGRKSDLREAFWYQKNFTIEEDIPEYALVKIHKAKFGIKVFLNGNEIGASQSCFTPNVFEITKFLHGGNQTNSLIIRVGAQPDAVAADMPWGHDFEKLKYIPGIYDNVEIILTGSIHVVRTQIVPDVSNESVRIVSIIENTSETSDVCPEYTVRESVTGKKIATVKGTSATIQSGSTHTFDDTIALQDCHVWSPEDPFLYELEISTDGDTCTERFGMRTFRFETNTGYAVLNGRQYFMRGTNVCIFGFLRTPNAEENHGMKHGCENSTVNSKA